MALNFPDNPTVGQVFGGWMWDSVKWGPAGASPNFPLPIVNGGTGANNALDALASLGAMPIVGGTFTGSVSMSGNASGALQPVPLQQMNAALGGYLPLSGGTMTGAINSTTSGNFGPSTIGGVTLSGSNISASGNLSGANCVCSNGVFVGGGTGPNWTNNGGAMYCGSTVQGGALYSATTLSLGVGGLYFQDNGGFIQAANANLMCGAIAIGNDPSVTWSFTSGYMATAPSVSANAFVETSDQRNKRDINPDLHGLVEILQLQPVTFIRADERRLEAGFIAQDVQSILPEAVVSFEPDLNPIAPDTVTEIAIHQAVEDGGGPLLGIQYSCITAALVNAIKELAAKVAALEAA